MQRSNTFPRSLPNDAVAAPSRAASPHRLFAHRRPMCLATRPTSRRSLMPESPRMHSGGLSANGPSHGYAADAF